MAGKLRFDVNFKMLKQDFVPLEQQEDNGESTVRVMELQFPRVEQPVKILQDPREGCGGHLWAAVRV